MRTEREPTTCAAGCGREVPEDEESERRSGTLIIDWMEIEDWSFVPSRIGWICPACQEQERNETKGVKPMNETCHGDGFRECSRTATTSIGGGPRCADCYEEIRVELAAEAKGENR